MFWAHLIHERLEEGVVRQHHRPVAVAGERPAGDGAHQSLLVLQAADQVRDQLRQVLRHAIHAPLRDGPQSQDA